ETWTFSAGRMGIFVPCARICSASAEPRRTSRRRVASTCGISDGRAVLDGLFVPPAATAVVEALASARADGAIAVVGHAKLALALRDGRSVLAVALPKRAAKKKIAG